MEEMRHTYIIFLGESRGKRPLGRPKHGWEDDIVGEISGFHGDEYEDLPSSGMLRGVVSLYQTTRHNMPEDGHL
jgi:hypothetical protein